MYHIYHIPGVKIGCSSNVESRIKLQKFEIYEILEEHNDIYVASKREIELQKQYGYKVDKIPFWLSLKRIKKAQKIGDQTREQWLPEVIKKNTGKKRSKKTKEKMSKVHKGKQYHLGKYHSDETKNKISKSLIGRSVSYETRNKISLANKGSNHYSFGKCISEEHKNHLQILSNNLKKKVIQKDKKGNIIKVWDSQSEAANSIGCSVSLINNVLKGIGKTAKGFIWENF